ncbi:glycerol kinase GlpK [Inhella gelatinilytica]|uniref:Glycerol kinase n=1 Tax=Inhella gelatinilytica TaxID=2795030 RepID=A0A931IXQ6_9BURK|nr:glycerol kinase GlpK [Inhella gelatinilytica]MBH9552945.1 glycerol kinase GlpK [Inhella gelatinilytica]
MNAVLALDQGTTSSRALIFDGRGRVVAQSQQAFEQHFPAPGWVEHDPQALWATQFETARHALQASGFSSSHIAALGLTNQRETVVLWDRASGQALTRAVVWQDRRTADLCQRLRDEGHEEEVRQRTGLTLDPYFSATKIAWWLDRHPEWRSRAERGELAVGTVDTWLLWKLTEGRVHATDVTNASRTLLMNLQTGQWDVDLLSLFGIPPALLPEIHPSASDFGTTRLFGGSIRIGGVAGDQQAALFGQGCVAPGQAKNTYGTGCFMLMHTGAMALKSKHGLLTTRACQVDAQAQFALEGSVFMGGATVQWLRDGLKMFQSSSEVEALARSVPDSGGVVVVPAFTGLGAPYWNAEARGAILGLSRGSTQAHIARAALEAITYQCADVLQAMVQDASGSELQLSELRVDGGASANDALMQWQADVLGVPVLRPPLLESTALGAASLAARMAGVELQVEAQEGRHFRPSLSPNEIESRMTRWHDAVRRVL